MPVQKALATARELGLFDDQWFLDNVDGRGGRLKGTDTICDTLSKDQIIAWVRNIHASGDGTAAGIVAALGWEAILSKTSQEALLFALDALAKKVGLVVTRARRARQRGARHRDPGFSDGGEGSARRGRAAQQRQRVPPAGDSWPELAAPGDMGYALAQSPTPGVVKPSYGMEGEDEEVTSEHRIPIAGVVPKPVTPEPHE